MLRIPFILILNLFSMIGFALDWAFHRVSGFFQRKPRYVQLRLSPSYPILRAEGWTKRINPQDSYFDLKDKLKTLSQDPDVTGLILEIDHIQMGAALSMEVAELIDQVRASGKLVVAHADMPMARDYMLGLSADKLLMTPAGRMYTFAPRFEQYFLAELFQKVGIHAQFVHLGAFKAAANRFLHTKMPLAHRLMMEELRDDFHTMSNTRVAERRNLEPTTANRWSEDAPLAARSARALGLIDGVAFRTRVKDWVETGDQHKSVARTDARDQPTPEDDENEIDIVKWDAYCDGGSHPELNWRPLRRRPQIAVVDLTGVIIVPGVSMGSGASIDPEQVLPLLKRLQNSRRVAGVLLHINSPGGSALSSDLIWQGIKELRADKAVVAYCSDVAASGGYYLAVGADEVYCRPESIMGSIGVIAGKFAAGNALAPLGITHESVAGDEASTFGSLFDPLPESVVAQLTEDTRAFYRRFLNRVGQARHIPKHRLHRYARGRVYTGETALSRGLVDGTGGLKQAMERLLTIVELDADEVDIKTFAHRHQSLSDLVKSSAMQATGTSAAFQARDLMNMFQREPTLAMMLLDVKGQQPE